MDLFRPFDKKARSAFRKMHRKRDDPQHVLACVNCDSDKVRPVKVSVHAGKCHTHVTSDGTRCEGADPAGWGTTINLVFECGCGEKFILEFQYYDQETECSVVNMGKGEATPAIYWQPEADKPRRAKGR